MKDGKALLPGRSGHCSGGPLPRPFPWAAAGTELLLRVAKKLRSAMGEKDRPDAGGRHFICKTVKSLKTNFLRRGLQRERGGKRKVYFLVSDTGVTLGRALPATRTHPLLLSEQHPGSERFSTDLSRSEEVAFL